MSTAANIIQTDSGSIAVRAIEDRRDYGNWNEFVQRHADGTFFHLAEWRDVITRSFGHRTHYLCAEKNGAICGVLPLAHVSSPLFGNALVSTPFCVYGGVVAEDAATRGALVKSACELAQRLGVDYLELRNRRRENPEWPAKDLYVTFRKGIDADQEANMLAIPRKQRAMVRKGMQKGLTSKLDDGVDRHYAIYSESLRNLGTPVFSRRYLKILRETFGDRCEVLNIEHEGQAVASVMSFYFRDEVLPYYGGSLFAARAVAGNDFMYWEAMERARQKGVKIFDYGRSKRGTGSFDFKVHWGFEPEQMHYEYFLVRAKQMPNLSPTNPKYEFVIRMWQRLPLAVTQLIGPWLAKYLG